MDMSTQPTSAEDKKHGGGFRFTTGIMSILNIVGLLLAYAVFLCGYQYLDIYYNHHHLESGLFPTPTTDYFVYGGYAIFRTAAMVFGDGTHSNLPMIATAALVMAVGMALYASVLLIVLKLLGKGFRILGRMWNMGDRVRQSAGKLRSHPHTKVVALAALGSLGAFALWIAVCLVVVLYVSVPSLIALYASKLEFHDEKDRLAGNCPQMTVDTKDVCMEVRDAGQQPIARGFIIASSPGYVALEEHNRVQFVSLENRQLVQLELPPAR